MYIKSVGILIFYIAFVQSRTIKTKILTNENGTKELVVDKGSDVPRRELEFLVEDLNHMNISVAVTTEKAEEVENKTELSESILMNHWNTLTEVGWNEASFRKPIRRMYINNTRVLQFEPVPVTESPLLQNTTEEIEMTTSQKPKLGRRIWSNEVEDDEEDDEEDETENTTESTELPENAEKDLEETSEFFSSLNFVFGCLKDHSLQSGLLRCVVSRVRSLVYPIWRKFDQGIDYYLNIFETCPQNATAVVTNTERTFYHRQRRFLYHVVLPLLAIILIKYLIALPFLLFGVFAVKSLFLGLFSAGTATLHSIAKKYEYLYPRFPVKRYRQVQGVEVGPPATASGVYWSQIPWQAPEEARGLGVYENLNMKEDFGLNPEKFKRLAIENCLPEDLPYSQRVLCAQV